jgi:hypothetical protein
VGGVSDADADADALPLPVGPSIDFAVGDRPHNRGQTIRSLTAEPKRYAADDRRALPGRAAGIVKRAHGAQNSMRRVRAPLVGASRFPVRPTIGDVHQR